MPYASVNHERLYFETLGDESKPKLVLIRGLARSCRWWGPMLPYVTDDFHVLIYDHRGIGRSEIQGRNFLLPDLARDLAELMGETGFDRAHVFGLSLGGMVAQHLALDHPGRVDKLVLGGTWAGGPEGTFPSIPHLLRLAVANRVPTKGGVRMMLRQLVSKGSLQKKPELVDEWLERIGSEPLDRKVVFRQALSGALHDVSTRLSSVEAETLVMTGDEDLLIRPPNSDHLHRLLPNSRLHILRGLAHEVTAEDPEGVAAVVKDFLLPAQSQAA